MRSIIPKWAPPFSPLFSSLLRSVLPRSPLLNHLLHDPGIISFGSGDPLADLDDFLADAIIAMAVDFALES